jgi:pimeloyl-ACP methyl ester carboxylesterase
MSAFRTVVAAGTLLLLFGCQAFQATRISDPVVKEMTVNGTTMTGEVVLFVPGSMSDWRVYESHREAIARSYRFISPTLRYFGPDPWPTGGPALSVATHVSDLSAFIRELRVGPVHVVGWSYGGSLAIILALQHPELVKSVFVYEQALVSWVTDSADLSAIGVARKAAFGPAVAVSKGGDQAAALRMFLDAAGGKPGAFDAMPASVRAMSLENARAVPLFIAAPPPPPVTCTQLGELRVPFAIVAGERTTPFYLIPAREAKRCSPRSTLTVVSNERHFWPVQSPSAFTDTVLIFLKGIGP